MLMLILKKINHRHYICIIITIIFLLYTVFYFKYAPGRFLETINNIYTSFCYYINELFELDMHMNLSVLELTKQPFEMPFNFPNNFDEFKLCVEGYFKLIISKENFINYLLFISNF